MTVPEVGSAVDGAFEPYHHDAEPPMTLLGVAAEGEQRRQSHPSVRGQQAEVAGRRSEVDLGAPEPRPEALTHEVVTKVVKAEPWDGLVLDRIGRSLAHEAEQLVPDARLDPAPLHRRDVDEGDLAACNHPAAHLDP